MSLREVAEWVVPVFLRPDSLYVPIRDLASLWTLPLPAVSKSAHLVLLDLSLITGLSFAYCFFTALPGCYPPWLASQIYSAYSVPRCVAVADC